MLINLDKYYILETNIKASENFSGGEVDYDVEASGELFANSGDDNNFQILLSLTIDKKKGSRKGPVPYSGKVKLAGIVTIDESVREDKREEFIMVNGMALLYGAAREYIASITSRGPWDTFYAPVVSFRKDADAVEGKVKK